MTRAAPARAAIRPAFVHPTMNSCCPTITGDYSSSVVRRFFDVRSPAAGGAALTRRQIPPVE
jgi:hypothetical protein